ncbi:MAG: hypothetical protein RI894_295 [Bacteroidota bacterium]
MVNVKTIAVKTIAVKTMPTKTMPTKTTMRQLRSSSAHRCFKTQMLILTQMLCQLAFFIGKRYIFWNYKKINLPIHTKLRRLYLVSRLLPKQ